MTHRRLFVIPIAALLTLALLYSGAVLSAGSHSASLANAEVQRTTRYISPEAMAADQSVPMFLKGLAEAEWYAGVQRAEDEARAAAFAAASSPRSSSTSSYHPGTTDDGECTGFAIPSYIIQRESGGNPSAYNPSGAYGCAQTLLSHYSRGSCQGLDPYTIQGQRDCVDILSNGGTNLAPWAQTR